MKKNITFYLQIFKKIYYNRRALSNLALLLNNINKLIFNIMSHLIESILKNTSFRSKEYLETILPYIGIPWR